MENVTESQQKRLERDAEWALSKTCASTVDDSARFVDIHKLLYRNSSFAAETSSISNPECHFREETNEGYLASGITFAPGKETCEYLADSPVLCVGAGGLGCEILKNLALSGFKNIHVIDGDTVDITNLNRQFLFRQKDVGSGKAFAAAEAIMKRVPGVTVTPRCSYIQQSIPGKGSLGDLEGPPIEYFRQFKVIICGLDNLEARSWMSDRLVEFVVMDQGKVIPSTVIPMVDGGTEGFKGQTHLIIPFVNPDFSKRMWMFPKQENFQLCTIADTPRKPEHCVAYAMMIRWDEMAEEKVRSGEWTTLRKYDTDSPSDMKWLYEQARIRAEKYNIEGVTYFFTMGVVKKIIPAIASSNAMVAAMCALEAFKLMTLCSQTLDNFTLLIGDEGMGCQTHSLGKSCQWHHHMNITGFRLSDPCSSSTTLGELRHLIASDMTLQMALFQWWYSAIDEAYGEEVSDLLEDAPNNEIIILSDLAGIIQIPLVNPEETVCDLLKRVIIAANVDNSVLGPSDVPLTTDNAKLYIAAAQDSKQKTRMDGITPICFRGDGGHSCLDFNRKVSEIVDRNRQIYLFQNPLLPANKAMLRDQYGESYILDTAGHFGNVTDTLSDAFNGINSGDQISVCIEHPALRSRSADTLNVVPDRRVQVVIEIL